MPRMKHRETGSVVNVPDEKVSTLYAMGYDVEKSDSSKTTAKKASSSKSSK